MWWAYTWRGLYSGSSYIIGSFQKRSILPPWRKFLTWENKLPLIIVNVLGPLKGVGGLTSYFLRGGGMDVF